jgi:hypothetical protein
VTRKGKALYEAWGPEQPIELLPGKCRCVLRARPSRWKNDSSAECRAEVEARRVP